MIKGVKVIRQFGKDNRITEFTYKDYHGGCLTEDFNKMTIADFEKLLEESLEWQRKCDEAIKRIETQRAAMTQKNVPVGMRLTEQYSSVGRMRPIPMPSLTDMSRKKVKIRISTRSEKICLYNQLHS